MQNDPEEIETLKNRLCKINLVVKEKKNDKEVSDEGQTTPQIQFGSPIDCAVEARTTIEQTRITTISIERAV